MRRNQRNMLIVGIIMMLVGIVIGVLAGEDLPIIGTVAPEKDNANIEASDSAELYYLVPIADAQEWLTETYPDLETTLGEEFTTVQSLSADNDFAVVIDNQENLLDTVLYHTHAALIGLEDVTEETDFTTVLPRDPEITACLGIDEDPFADVGPDVVLYLVVPTADAGKNIPTTWEPTDPKTGTSMFWTPLRCSPLDGS